MKLLFIGGTGLLSSACSDLAAARDHELFLLNRSTSAKYPPPAQSHLLQADIHGSHSQLEDLLKPHHFDAVVDFIAFTTEDIERDLNLFRGRTDHFVFISSASAYQKPPQNYFITESTPLENPFWQYSRDKIACEKRLRRAYQQEGFPVTIIRPSLTYGPTQIPILGASWEHPWTLIDRMQQGKPVIIPGDGTSLWVLTWNQDFAKGLLGLLGRREAVGEAFQITSDEVLTWDQIMLELYRALDLEPAIVHVPSDLIVAYDPGQLGTLVGDKINSVVFDNTKLKRFIPDFVCEVKWAEGIRRTLAWFQAHPQFKTLDAGMNLSWDRILAGYKRAFPS